MKEGPWKSTEAPKVKQVGLCLEHRYPLVSIQESFHKIIPTKSQGPKNRILSRDYTI